MQEKKLLTDLFYTHAKYREIIYKYETVKERTKKISQLQITAEENDKSRR